jgi:hypothetical protein
MAESDPGRRREKFVPEEDARLRQLVSVYGTNSWEVIAAGVPGRNARQCRERWKHYLSSETQTAWTEDEDRQLYLRMEQIGPRWTILASFFPGRTDIQIKNRWMQRFADTSNLHIEKRHAKAPQFIPTTQYCQAVIAPHVAYPQGTIDQGVAFRVEALDPVAARRDAPKRK